MYSDVQVYARQGYRFAQTRQPGLAHRTLAPRSVQSRAPLALLPCELQARHIVGLRPKMAPVWGFLDACAFTALFEADVLMHFVDSFVPVSQESCVKLETRAECCPAASARLVAPTSHCAGV